MVSPLRVPIVPEIVEILGYSKALKKAQEDAMKVDINEVGVDNYEKIMKNMEDKLRSQEQQKTAAVYGLSSAATGFAGDELKKLLKTGFGFVEEIYNKLLNASPLLQAFEQLFNLVVQMFFMPLGNKLAEVLIPAVLDLLDDVMSMWDSFEGKSLGEIFGEMIRTGVDYFLQFFNKVGDELSRQGGLIGGIGELIKKVTKLLEGGRLVFLLEAGTNVLGFVLDHIIAIIGWLAAFKTMQLALGLAQIAATLVPDKAKWATGILGVGVALSAIEVIGTGTADLAVGLAAKGGYVTPADGGTLILAGEGGEGEWIIPESKVDSFIDQNIGRAGRSGDVYNITVNGYTDHDLSDKIKDTVNELSNRSRIRSGL